MKQQEFLDILHVAERLKDTPRHCTTSKRRVESVAEHSWRLTLMAFLLKHEFPELDTDKVVRMCLIHDLGECFTGDIPTFDKTSDDEKKEEELLSRWVSSLPAEISNDMSALYDEMNRQETKEAKLYKALDRLEAVIQHNESPLDTWVDNEYELNKTYGSENAAFSEWLTELRRVLREETEMKIRGAGMKTLETERLILRALTADDAQKMYDNWTSDPEVAKYMTWYAHESVDVTRSLVDMWLEEYGNKDCTRYVIERKEDGELMGMIDVVRIEDGVPEIGYCSGKRFWGNGYMTEAVKAFLGELFDKGYEAVTIEAVKENIGSNRVIQKNGFTFVGEEVRPHSDMKPELVTLNTYRLNKADWQEQNRRGS